MHGASSTALKRSADLLAQGPSAPAPGRSVRQRLRAQLRAAVLRALRPHTVYQHLLDEAIVRSVAYQSEQIERLELFISDLISGADALRVQHAELAAATGQVSAALGEVSAATEGLAAELRAAPYIAGEPFHSFATPVGEVTGYTVAPIAAGGESAYAGFEDLFRGPAERVTELQRPYLALVADHQPVLDLGCGRGEFLTLLAVEGIAAAGVDSDPGMVERCRARGLPVVLGDGIEHLEQREDASVGTVFCAQVIEHLSPPALRRLLVLARRKLVPGGLLIAETVNPHNLAALKTFWVDVTHRHPIFPEAVLTLCAGVGFAPAYVFAPGHGCFEEARTASTTYAVVAVAPVA